MTLPKNTAKSYSLLSQGVYIVLFALLFSLNIQARVPEFSKIFGSNMVLPYGKAILLSGYASPGATLVLEVNESKYDSIMVDAKGEWQKEIAPLPAGGPYRIRISDNSGAEAVLEMFLQAMSGSVPASQIWPTLLWHLLTSLHHTIRDILLSGSLPSPCVQRQTHRKSSLSLSHGRPPLMKT
jgi:hypothetical protein